MGTKITALGAIPEVANVDVLPIVDLTDTTTKKATITQIEARFTADGFLSALDNISELTNDSGYITVSDFSNDGENAGVDRDLGNLDAFALSFITSGVGRINIEAGGNVGIGTSTPSEVLEVVGSTKISGNITQTDASASTSLAGGDIRFEDNGGGLPTIWLNQTTYDINTASFWQLGSGASTIQARNVPTGGQFENRIQNDVGKGSKLEFPADVHSSWYQVGNAGITHKYFNMGNTGYGLGLRAGTLEINSANDFVFSKYDGATAPTDLIKILGASGNVGIGTATPTEKLEVVGNVFVTGTQKIKTDYLSSNLSLENTSGSSTYEIGVGVAGVSVETLYFNNRLGNRTFGINLDGRFDIIEKVNLEDNIELKWGNNVSYGAFFDANYEQKMTFNNAGGRTIAFDNKAGAGSPNYTFDWSGAIKGNFGIGTLTPTETLEVVGNAKINGNNLLESSSIYVQEIYKTTNSGSFGIDFHAKNSLNVKTRYGSILANIENNADGAEEGSIRFALSEAGAVSSSEHFKFRINGLIETKNSGNLGTYRDVNAINSLGGINMYMNDSLGNIQSYGFLFAKIEDNTSGSDDASIVMGMAKNGNPDSNGIFQFYKEGIFRSTIGQGTGIYSPQNTVGVNSSFSFWGENSVNARHPYAFLASEIIDNTSGSEDGALRFNVIVNGALNSTTSKMTLTGTGLGIGTNTPTEKLDLNGRQFLSNQTAPSTPTGGGTIFVDGGALKYIGSSGTITTLGVA